MSDYISRQAAIDITMQYCPDDDGSCSKADSDIRELLDDLENMPSAQQRGTVVTCGIDKCKHNNDGLCKAESIYLSEDHYCDGGCDDGWVFDEKEELKIKGEES